MRLTLAGGDCDRVTAKLRYVKRTTGDDLIAQLDFPRNLAMLFEPGKKLFLCI